MSGTANEQLIAQLSCYLIDLQNVRTHINQHASLPRHLILLKQKIAIKISHFQTTVNQLRLKDFSEQAIKNMNLYSNRVFSQIIKESHRLLQMKVLGNGEEKLKEKLSVLKQVEIEMDEEWQRDKNVKQKSILKSIGKNLSMLTQQLSQKQLKSMAKQYLHKEFLAIRMAAYNLYQEYTTHSHPGLTRQANELKKEHQELAQQAKDLKQMLKNLKDEQKRLQRQLNEIKRVNNLISTRYFMSSQQPHSQK